MLVTPALTPFSVGFSASLQATGKQFGRQNLKIRGERKPEGCFCFVLSFQMSNEPNHL